MEKLTTLILVLLILLNCSSKTAKEHYEKAVELENADKYEEAIGQLDKAIAQQPEFEQALLDRAIDKAIIGNYESAIDDLDELIRLHPDAIEPYVWRAEYKRMLERYEDAMADVKKALALKQPIYRGTDIIGPKEFNINRLYPEGDNFNIELEFIVFERGAANYHLGNFEQALKDFEFCKQPQARPINTHYYMGLTLIEHGRMEEACVELQKAVESGEEGIKDVVRWYCEQ